MSGTTEQQRQFRFINPNPIRAVGERAQRSVNELGLPWYCQLHLGNPGTDQEPEVPLATTKSVVTRLAGYAPHHGLPENRTLLAEFLNDVEQVPGHFIGADVFFVPGATVITDIIMKSVSQAGDTVLLPQVGYPPYENQAVVLEREVKRYLFDSRGLLDHENLRTLINLSPDKTKLLVITYPHNPTGKSLTQEEAREIAATINSLTTEFPHLVIYNDAVYNATVAPELGYNGFFTYLSASAQKMTISGVSGAKMTAQGAERIGGIACSHKELRTTLENVFSATTAGSNIHAEHGFCAALTVLKGSFRPAPFQESNPRHTIANYYGTRRKLVADTLRDVASCLGEDEIRFEDPLGGMYLYARFGKLVLGRPVPEAVRDDVGSAVFESGNHFASFLLALPRLGYAPVATVPGEAFGDNAQAVALRISCVTRSLIQLKEAMNSLRGAFQEMYQIDCGGRSRGPLEELKQYLMKLPT